MTNPPTTATRTLLLALPVFFLACAILAAMGGFGRPGAGGDGDHATRPHEHASVHGGLVQSVGKQHVELVRERGGGIRLYLLGEDEAELRPIRTRALTAHVLTEGVSEAVPMTLQAEPQPGEPRGASSTFAGKLPDHLTGAPVTLTVSVPADRKTYRARFHLQTHDADGSHAEAALPPMPAAGSPDAERQLFTTTGGRYTAADIAANGIIVPSQRYAAIAIQHDPNPAIGERVCPITQTKANPKLVWTIGGQEYQFCCPPCITEFVQRARTEPETIQPPQEYVKR